MRAGREYSGAREYSKPKDFLSPDRVEELRKSDRRSSGSVGREGGEDLRRGSGEDRRRGSGKDDRDKRRGSEMDRGDERRGSEKDRGDEKRGSEKDDNEGSGRKNVWVNSNRYMGSEEVEIHFTILITIYRPIDLI